MRKWSAIGFLLLMISAAAAAQKVSTDFDHNANFATYKTYKWAKQPSARDPLMNQWIIEGINSQLAAKGWTLVADAPADVNVMANVATREERSFDRYYNGGGWRWGGGFATTVVNNYAVGTLVVDMFDTNTHQAIWRAVASDTISDKPSKNTKNLNKSIDKMFKDFPPKK